MGRTSSLPLWWNTAPARTSAARFGALPARQRAWAASTSLQALACRHVKSSRTESGRTCQLVTVARRHSKKWWALCWCWLDGDIGEHENSFLGESLHGRPNPFSPASGVFESAVRELVCAVAGDVPMMMMTPTLIDSAAAKAMRRSWVNTGL